MLHTITLKVSLLAEGGDSPEFKNRSMYLCVVMHVGSDPAVLSTFPPSRVQQESLRSLEFYDNQVVAQTSLSERAEGGAPCVPQ